MTFPPHTRQSRDHLAKVPKPHADSVRVLRDLAYLLDNELDDTLLLSPREFIARELGVAPGSLASQSSEYSELEFVTAARAVARLLHQHPDCAVMGSKTGAAPRWSDESIGEPRLVPRSITLVVPAGVICAASVGIRLREAHHLHGMTQFVEIIAEFTELTDAAPAVLALFEEEWERRNPYRGAVLEVRGDDAHFDLYPVDIPASPRERLILPREVWEEIDLNIHGHFAHMDVLKGCGLGANRGLLLTGPPGNGKTAVCRVLAHELAGRVTVLFADAATVRRNVAELYRQAALFAPVLVVLEDVDLIVRDRSHGGPTHELVEFLLAVDGAVTQHTGVVTIATTNDPRAIDPAARRAARFDRLVEVPAPCSRARAAILDEYIRPLGVDVDTARLAQLTDGASGADLRELVRLGVLHHGADLTTERLTDLARQGGWRAPASTGNYL